MLPCTNLFVYFTRTVCVKQYRALYYYYLSIAAAMCALLYSHRSADALCVRAFCMCSARKYIDIYRHKPLRVQDSCSTCENLFYFFMSATISTRGVLCSLGSPRRRVRGCYKRRATEHTVCSLAVKRTRDESLILKSNLEIDDDNKKRKRNEIITF